MCRRVSHFICTPIQAIFDWNLIFNFRIALDINLDISCTTSATLLASETRYQYIRCVAPSYRSSGELQLAVGLANGKVGLCNFVPSNENNIEFSKCICHPNDSIASSVCASYLLFSAAPKQTRPCVCLAWHETETRLLAIGHDRNRSDHCITVWDTERGVTKENATLHLIGLSETAHSLCWEKNARILFAGMSHKYLKMMDLRQSTPTVNMANTRAIHGVSIAPNGRLMASFIDNSISLWDVRNFERPISMHPTEKNINDLSWCATRSSTLATLQRDSPYVHLLDFHCSSLPDAADVEMHSIKRIVSPFQKRITTGPRNITMSNISWHPYDTERLLALSGSGIICDFRIQHRIAISWDPSNNLCGAIGIQLSCLNPPSPPSTPCESLSPWDSPNFAEQSSEDIADVMHRRAMNDYGKLVSIPYTYTSAMNRDRLIEIPILSLLIRLTFKRMETSRIIRC